MAGLPCFDLAIKKHIATFSPTFSPPDLLLYNNILTQLKADRTAVQLLISNATTTATTTYTTVNSSVYTRKYAASAAITTAEATNLQTRNDTDKQTASEYAIAENTAWNIYYVSAVAADVAYLTKYCPGKKIYKKNSTFSHLLRIGIHEQQTWKFFGSVTQASSGGRVDPQGA